MRYTILTLASLLTTLRALQITSPALGASIDPSQPITVRWTTSPSDPATFTLTLLNADVPFTSDNSGGTNVGTNIQTSAGSYTIPANTIAAFGAGFSFVAKSAAGDNVGTSGTFLLGYGLGRVITGSNGQFSLAPSPTDNAGAQSTSLSSLIFDTSGVTGSMTATYLPSTNIVPTVGSAASSLSSFTFTDVTGSMTIQPTSSSNRVSSVSSAASSAASSASSAILSASSSASRSSASAASTVNSQPRIGAGKEVMGVAGLLAGLVAVIV